MKFGLKEETFKNIIKTFPEFEEIEKVIIFGSRSMGNFKTGSDIDLAVMGNSVTLATIQNLNQKFNEELPIPHKCDILDGNRIKNPELLNHIHEKGQILYLKSEKS